MSRHRDTARGIQRAVRTISDIESATHSHQSHCDCATRGPVDAMDAMDAIDDMDDMDAMDAIDVGHR